MSDDTLHQLRHRLEQNLERLLHNPSIERKELAAFDLLVGRNAFLKSAELGAVTALIDSGYAPTAWGRMSPDFAVDPAEVDLTATEIQSVSKATQLLSGTELFKDAIYSQPIVTPQDTNSHAVIEGGAQRFRLQSDLATITPEESQFLDRNYHYGPTELIQLEHVDGKWECAHYHYPWGSRNDGAKTDGLARAVVAGPESGLIAPTKVLAITGTFTNRFEKGNNGVTTSITYLVYIEQDHNENQVVALGRGHIKQLPAGQPLSGYPIVWTAASRPFPPETAIYVGAEIYRNCGMEDNGTYNPAKAFEVIVLYNWDEDDKFGFCDFIALTDGSTTNELFTCYFNFDFPTGIASMPKVVHIEWDPTSYKNNSQSFFQSIVFAETALQSNGDCVFNTYTCIPATEYVATHMFAGHLKFWFLNLHNWEPTVTATIDASKLVDQGKNNAFYVDYSKLTDVHNLFRLAAGEDDYHVKLCNVTGNGIFVLVIKSTAGTYSNTAHFRLQLPPSAGVGTILNFSGGLSKFGGYRFMVCDQDGNAFLMRQRRAADPDTPYAKPIYINNDATGLPLVWTEIGPAPHALPDSVASTSNLQGLPKWTGACPPNESDGHFFNLIQQTALGFCTDNTGMAQGIWLGNTFKAAYMRLRMSHDSEHIAVKQVQSGSTEIFTAYNVYKNVVDKTWRVLPIANQTTPAPPEQMQSGDHYQASLTPANAYGQRVSLQTKDNANIAIEVRADAPCQVTDDTTNYYYNIDRYTSFTAMPDPASGQLHLVVKAQTFSQVLYARLVNTSSLSPSSDTAMLSDSTPGTTYPWMMVNIAAQAQQRMSNGSTKAASGEVGDPSTNTPDTTQYISEQTFRASNGQSAWQTRGGSPTSTTLTGLADYLNKSGQSLITSTGQLSSSVDPLMAITPLVVASDPTPVNTAFNYDSGTVEIGAPTQTLRCGKSYKTVNSRNRYVARRCRHCLRRLWRGLIICKHCNSSSSSRSSSSSSTEESIPTPEVGTIWSAMSHALHDALHYLQHMDDKVAKELKSAVKIVSDAENFTVVVGKDIMKAINGVDQDLNEVVTTVEEYASVVVNIMVTIVESSWIFQFIERIIELISLFIHIEDIMALNKSLQSLFGDLFSGANGRSIPVAPSSFSTSSLCSTYFGADNTLQNAMAGVPTDNVVESIAKELGDLVLGNPFANKILNKILSAISAVMTDVASSLPMSFDMDPNVVQTVMDDVNGLKTTLVDTATEITLQSTEDLIQLIGAEVENPKQTYENLKEGLGTFTSQIETDLTDVFDFVDGMAKNAPTFAKSMIDWDGPFFTLDIAILADLCKLFGFGTMSNDKFRVSAADAVFFPIALLSWTATYMHKGKSINSADELLAFSNTNSDNGDTNVPLWTLIRLVVDGTLQGLGGLSWLIGATTQNSGNPTAGEKLFATAGKYINWMRWVNDFAFTCATWNPMTGRPLDYAFVSLRLTTACTAVVYSIPSLNLNTGDGWPSDPSGTDLAQALDALMTIGITGYDIYSDAKSSMTTSQIISLVGQTFARTQVVAATAYNITKPESALAYFAVYILVCPGGFALQAAEVNV